MVFTILVTMSLSVNARNHITYYNNYKNGYISSVINDGGCELSFNPNGTFQKITYNRDEMVVRTGLPSGATYGGIEIELTNTQVLNLNANLIKSMDMNYVIEIDAYRNHTRLKPNDTIHNWSNNSIYNFLKNCGFDVNKKTKVRDLDDFYMYLPHVFTDAIKYNKSYTPTINLPNVSDSNQTNSEEQISENIETERLSKIQNEKLNKIYDEKYSKLKNNIMKIIDMDQEYQ